MPAIFVFIAVFCSSILVFTDWDATDSQYTEDSKICIERGGVPIKGFFGELKDCKFK
jgi:hypothetical protein